MAFFFNVRSQSWLWAKSADGSEEDISIGICSDANGNIFVLGNYLSPTITFGNITLVNSGNFEDIFIVKYDAAGNVLWAKSIGGNLMDAGMGICTDTNGNVIVTGTFLSATMAIGNFTLTNENVNFFVAKFDSNGNPMWAKCASGTSGGYATGLAADPFGNVFVTGVYTGSLLTIATTTLTHEPTTTYMRDIFIAKYDISGNLLWAKSAGGSNEDWAKAICSDNNGNVTITGKYASQAVNFGNNIVTSNSGGGNDYNIFVVNYNGSGVAQWAATGEGLGTENNAYGICADLTGNTFITGDFESPVLNFTSASSVNSATLANSGTSGTGDFFLVKLNSSGAIAWVKSATGSVSEVGHSVCADSDGNVTVIGDYWSLPVVFGSMSLPTNNTMFDVFIVKYDSIGNVSWVNNFGGTTSDSGMGICKTQSGETLVTGMFQSPRLAFGNDTLVRVVTPYNTFGVYVAKFDDNTVTNIEEQSFYDGIKIFPNPFFSQTILESSYPFDNATITMDNCVGQTVKKTENISGTEIILSRDNLPRGLYFIRLRHQGRIITTKKIIISD